MDCPGSVKEREESKMPPNILAQASRRMDFRSTEVKKILEVADCVEHQEFGFGHIKLECQLGMS